MKAKILTLGLVCLFIFLSCDKEIKNPYSPSPPEPPDSTAIIVGIKEYRFKMTIDFTDVLFPFPPPDYSYWEGYVHIYRGDWPIQISSIYWRGAGIIEKEWTVFPEAGSEWQAKIDEIHTIKARYFHGVMPPEWQEKIRWRFQVDIELSDPQFQTTIWSGENEGNDTGYFEGWYATTPEWYSWQKITLFTFLIQ